MNATGFAAGVVAVAAVAWLGTSWLRQGEANAAPVPVVSAPPAAVVAAPAPEPATGELVAAAKPATAPVDRSRELELPDGTFVPALNGAVGAAPLSRYWGPFPWSPIVGTERSEAGIDWYRHADGSYSTTQMVWRKDLGRYDAMTRVAHPGPGPTSTGGPAVR